MGSVLGRRSPVYRADLPFYFIFYFFDYIEDKKVYKKDERLEGGEEDTMKEREDIIKQTFISGSGVHFENRAVGFATLKHKRVKT